MARRRYRRRTGARRRAPARLARWFPKGARDCREHEWYLASLEPLVYHCCHCSIGIYHGDPYEPWDRLVRSSRALRAHTIHLAALRRTYVEPRPWLIEFQDRLRAEIEAALEELPGGSRFDEAALVRLAEDRWSVRAQ